MLEAGGYISKAARWKDPSLLPQVAALIDTKLVSTRQEFAKFCIWWADIAHNAHIKYDAAISPFEQDFWHCTQPLCLSLVGTVSESISCRTCHGNHLGYKPPDRAHPPKGL